MDTKALQKWLGEPRVQLIEAVRDGVVQQVTALKAGGIDFYGYAILPGEPHDLKSLVAVANTEADIAVPPTDKLYRYYRYGVDEWKHWEYEEFAVANGLIGREIEQLRSMHTKGEDDFQMDEFEVAHANVLLDAILQGLEAAKAGNAFGTADPFLVIWISDSGHGIMAESVRRLNSPTIVREFMQEFS